MGKRARGEGSLYQRKDGYWVGQYRANGKTRYIYGKEKKEVRTKLTEAIANKDKGIVYDAGSLTFGAYLDTWLESVQGSLKARSVERYEADIRVHIKPVLGSTKIIKLDALQLHYFYRDKLNSGLAVNTVRMMHVIIHKAMKQAVRWKLIPHNIADDVDAPRGPKQR